jgi:hypothetical protein
MKTLLKATLLSMLLFAAFMGSTINSKAVWWVDELGDCSASYIAIGNDIEWEYANSLITQTQRNNLHNQNSQQMQNCVSPISAPSEQPDFCADARIAKERCVTDFSFLSQEYLSGYMQCMAASNIYLCE